MSDSHYYSVCMEHGDYIDRDGVTQWGAKETCYIETDDDLCGAMKQFLDDYQRARGTTKARLLNVRPYTFPSFMDYR